MRLVQYKCPSCGANVHVEEGKDRYFCSNCGAELHVDSGEVIVRHVDEAEVIRAKLEVDKEMQRRIEADKAGRSLRRLFIGLIIFVIASIILMRFE